MADTRLTPIRIRTAFALCWYAIAVPGRLDQAAEADNQARDTYSGKPEHRSKSAILTRAFWLSLALVIAAGSVGGAVSSTLGLFACTTRVGEVSLQLSGTLFILWATAFVRGWDIQTYAGTTLIERVNRWLYLGLSCIGTALLAGSLFVVRCN